MYKHLIQKQLSPLLNSIKWFRQLYITNHEPFSNFHHKRITAIAREVTYHLLYNTTQTTQREMDWSQQVLPCRLCIMSNVLNTQEDELNLFFLCPTIRDRGAKTTPTDKHRLIKPLLTLSVAFSHCRIQSLDLLVKKCCHIPAPHQ